MTQYIASAALKEVYSQEDFRIFNDIIEQTPSTFWDKQIQYNQDLVHKNSCFIHGPIGAITDLTGYKWTTKEIKDLVDFAWTQDWADPSWGGWFNEAIKFVAKQAISRKIDVIYYRIPSKDYLELLKRGYSIVTGFNVSPEWLKDKEDDKILNHSVGEYGKPSNGHCIRLTMKENRIYVIDNYFNRKGYTNIYEVKDIQSEVDKGIFFSCGYIYCKHENVKDGFQGMTLEQKIAKLRERTEVRKQFLR